MVNALSQEQRVALRMGRIVHANSTIKVNSVKIVPTDTLALLVPTAKVSQSDTKILCSIGMSLIFLECNCETSGTKDLICGKTDGKCICKDNVAGNRCQKCADGFYNYPDCDKSKVFFID